MRWSVDDGARQQVASKLDGLGPQLAHGRRFPEPFLEQWADREDPVVLAAVLADECTGVGDVESERERTRAADAPRDQRSEQIR